jgi:hypothetical protein
MDKSKIGFYIPLVLFIATVIGWAYDSGRKSSRIDSLKTEIEVLKKDNNDVKEFIKQQSEFNGKVAFIVDRLSFHLSD